MEIKSPDFENNQYIPKKYTCDEDDVNPTLKIYDIPEETASMVLVVDDPDAPIGTWDHWIIFNIPKDTEIIPEDSVPSGMKGKNSWGTLTYGGPCPPDGEHRYFFKVYALDTFLDLEEGVEKQEVEKAMQGHILDQAYLVGKYKRS